MEKTLTPVLLCWYASIGDVKQLKELIRLGVDLNLQDYDQRTAFHLAVAENQIKIIDLLIMHNVALKHDLRGETPFNDALRAENYGILNLLKTKYGPIDISKINKCDLATEMCIAVANNDITKIKLYIECQVPLDLQDYDGRTPLHIAASNGNKKIYQILIDAGAS